MAFFAHAHPTGQSPHIRALLFDLDGVLTPTVDIHMRAWAETFQEFFAARNDLDYREREYYESLDGRNRFDGVQTLLAARGIELPWGSDDDTGFKTVCGIGNEKNRRFQEVLRRDGIAAYPGSLDFLNELTDLHLKLAVVSSSRNAIDVLKAAGIYDRFAVIVDGNVAKRLGLAGKPDPATYSYAAEKLGVPPDEAAVFEDALSGVAAGKNGNFAEVIGVDRGSGAEALQRAGASRVVTDLAELLNSTGQ